MLPKRLETRQNRDRIPEDLVEALYPSIRACRKGRRTCELHTSDIASTTMHDLVVLSTRHPHPLKTEDLRRLAFRIARDVTFDFIRKARRRLLVGRQMLEDAKTVDGSPCALVSGLSASPVPMDDDIRCRIVDTMSTLDPRDQELVRMWHDGANWEQIAASTSCTAATARKRWQRIRLKLQRELSELA